MKPTKKPSRRADSDSDEDGDDDDDEQEGESELEEEEEESEAASGDDDAVEDAENEAVAPASPPKAVAAGKRAAAPVMTASPNTVAAAFRAFTAGTL
jgi:hypothetical protein